MQPVCVGVCVYVCVCVFVCVRARACGTRVSVLIMRGVVYNLREFQLKVPQ